MSVNIYNREANVLIPLSSESDLLAYTTEGQVVTTTITASSWAGFMQLLATGLSNGTYSSNTFVEAIINTVSVYGFVIAESATVVRFVTSVCARIYDTETAVLVTTSNLHGLPFITSTTNAPAGVSLLNGEAIYFKDSSNNTCTIDAKSRVWEYVSTSVMATMKSNASSYSGAFYNDTDGYYLFTDNTYYKLNDTVNNDSITASVNSSNCAAIYKATTRSSTTAQAGRYRTYVDSVNNFVTSGSSNVPCGILMNTSANDDGYSAFDYILCYTTFLKAVTNSGISTVPTTKALWKTWITDYMTRDAVLNSDSSTVSLFVPLGLERKLGYTTDSLIDSWYNFKTKFAELNATKSDVANYVSAWIEIIKSNDSSAAAYTITNDTNSTSATVYGKLAKPYTTRKVLYSSSTTQNVWDSSPGVTMGDWYDTYASETKRILKFFIMDGDTAQNNACTQLAAFRNSDVYKDKNQVWFFFKLASQMLLDGLRATDVSIKPYVQYKGGIHGTVNVSNATTINATTDLDDIEESIDFKVTPSGIYTEDSEGNDVCVVPKVQDQWSRRESISIVAEGLPHGSTFGYNTEKGTDTAADPAYVQEFDDTNNYVFAHKYDDNGVPTYGTSTATAEDTPAATASKNAKMKGFPTASEVQLGTRKIDVALPLASQYSDIGDGSCTVPLTLGNFARLLFGNKYNKVEKEFGGHLTTGSTDKYLSHDGSVADEFSGTSFTNIPLDSQLEISEESGWANMGLFDISSRYVSDYLSIAGIGNPNNVDASVENGRQVAVPRQQRSTGCNAVQYYDGVKKTSRNRFKLGSSDYVSDDTTVGVAYTANALDFPVTGCMSLRTHIPLHSREQAASNLPYIPGYCYPFGGNAACGYSSGNCDDKLYVEPTATDGVGFNSSDVRQFPMHKAECGNATNYTAGGHGKTMIPVFGRMLTLMSCVAQQVTMINYNGEWTGTRSPFISGYFWSTMASAPISASANASAETSNYGYSAGTTSGASLGTTQLLTAALWNCKLNMCGMFPRPSTRATYNDRAITYDALSAQGGPGVDNDAYGFYSKVLGTGCVYHPGYRLVQHTPGIDCGMYTGIVSGIKLGCAQFRQYQNNSTNHTDNTRPLGQQFQPDLSRFTNAKALPDGYMDTPATNGLTGWGVGAPNILTDTTSTLSYVPGSGVNWKLEFQSWGLNDLKPFGVAAVQANSLETNYYIHDDAYSPSGNYQADCTSNLRNLHFDEYGDTANGLRSGTFAEAGSDIKAYTYSTLADVFTFSFPTGMPEFGLGNTHTIANYGNAQAGTANGLSNVVTARVRIFNCYGKIIALSQDVFKYGGDQYGLAGYASVTGQQFNLSTVEPFAITVAFSDSTISDLVSSDYKYKGIRLPANNVQVHWYNNVNSIARTYTNYYSVDNADYMGNLINRQSDLYCDIDIHVDYQYTSMMANLWSTDIATINTMLAGKYYAPEIAVYNTDGLAFAEPATSTGLRYIFSGKYMTDAADDTNLYAIRKYINTIAPSSYSYDTHNVFDGLQYFGIHTSEQILDGFSNYVAFPNYVYDEDEGYIYAMPDTTDFGMNGSRISNNTKSTDGGFWMIPGPNNFSAKSFGGFKQGTFILAYDCNDHSKCKVFRVMKNLTTSNSTIVVAQGTNYNSDSTSVRYQYNADGTASSTQSYLLGTVTRRYAISGNFKEMAEGDIDNGAPIVIAQNDVYTNTIGSTEDTTYISSYTS